MAYPVNKIFSFTLENKHNYFYTLYKDFYVVLLDTIYANPYNSNEYFEACTRLFNDISKTPISNKQLSANYSQTYMGLMKILGDPLAYTSQKNPGFQSFSLTKDMNFSDVSSLLVQQNDLINPVAPVIDHLDMELMLQVF